MKVVWKTSLLVGLLLLLSACQTNIKNIATPIGQEPLRVNPVNVQTEYINVQALEPQALNIASGNLFDNSGFESGLEGWTACSAGTIKTSGDAYEGLGALEVVPDNCFYRSTEVSPGQDLVLSCYVKVTSGNAWTGMGMGFADSSWSTVGEAPATVISGNAYARYDVMVTAPENSKYASMWLYSENATVVDNCSLMLEATPPPPPSGDNLLENGNFETLSNGNPTEWSQGCGGTASSVAGREGNGFSLSGGICVDQGLSAGDVAALSGNDYTYSCYAKNTGGYASLSIFFNDVPVSKVIPVSNSFQLVELKGTAPQASSSFVSIYSEGNIIVDQCLLSNENTVPPLNNHNLLKNASFENLTSENKPQDWVTGCSGIAIINNAGKTGKGLTLKDGACVDYILEQENRDNLEGKYFSYTCFIKHNTDYKHTSISIALNTNRIDKINYIGPLPRFRIGEFSIAVITGKAPEVLEDAFVSVYSEGNITIDDCQLETFDSNPEILIPDPILARQIRKFLLLDNDTPITKVKLLELTYIDCQYRCSLAIEPNAIKDLSGLEYAKNLTTLHLPTSEISDISNLANLTNLIDIDLSNNLITEVGSFSNLHDLTRLKITDNLITSLNGLGIPRSLSNLDLSRNYLSSVEELAIITTLKELNLSENPINNLDAISNLTNLHTLFANECKINSVQSLNSLASLKFLALSYNSISDLSPLSNLVSLEKLWLSNNSLTNIAPLSTLTALNNLDLTSNSIIDITGLAGLINLGSLQLLDNQITSIAPLVTNAGLANHTNSVATRYNGVGLQANRLDLTPGSQAQSDIQTLIDRQINVRFEGQEQSFGDEPIIYSTETVEYREIRRALGLEVNEPLTRNKLLTLTKFEYSGLGRPDSEKLTSVGLLGAAKNLIEVRIPHNKIYRISNLTKLPNLKILDASSNSIGVQGIGISSKTINSIEFFDFSDNNIRSLHGLIRTLSLGPNSTLDLRSNRFNNPLSPENLRYLEILRERGVTVLY